MTLDQIVGLALIAGGPIGAALFIWAASAHNTLRRVDDGYVITDPAAYADSIARHPSSRIAEMVAIADAERTAYELTDTDANRLRDELAGNIASRHAHQIVAGAEAWLADRPYDWQEKGL